MDSKELKMQLLEQLMQEMGDSSISKLKKPEPVAEVVEVKKEEIPASDLESKLKEKLMSGEDCEDEEDDYSSGSNLLQRLKEMKAKKA